MPLWVFWALLTVVYSAIFITIEFSGTPFSSFQGFLVIFSQWCVVSLAAGGVLGLINFNRIIFAVLFPLLVLLSVAVAYFRISMGVVLTPVCIELAFVTDMKTSMTVISPQLIASELLGLGLAGFIVWWRWEKVHIGRRLYAYIYMAMSVMLVVLPFAVKRISAPVFNRLPYSLWYNIDQYLHNRHNIEEYRDTFDDVSVTKDGNAPDVVVIIGESLRADHLNINGYGRCTMPLLSQDTAVVALPNITTVPFHTFRSVPHIMTRADSVNTEAAFTEQSFITLFKKAGYSTAWLSNQDMLSSYAYFMHEADSLLYGNAVKSIYGFDKWLDIDLIPHLESILACGVRPKLVVMHTIGSHWWYKSHYDDSRAVFKPEINSRVLSDLTDEQLINSYDNTIVETDYFLWNVIGRIKGRNAVMIYISDHGEALGENGNYMHAADYPQLHNPAMLVWYSEKYKDCHRGKILALKNNRKVNASTDILFHSVIDAAALSTTVLDKSLSVFSYEM